MKKEKTYRKDTEKRGLKVLAKEGRTGIDRYLPKSLHGVGESLSEDEVEYMRTAAMAGATVSEVADALGIDRRTLLKWIEQKPGLAREWRAATAAGRIGVKRQIFEMGMDGKMQALSLAVVNLTDFKFTGKNTDGDEETQAVALTGDMTKEGVLAKMAEEINKLPEADRIEIAKQINSGVITTPKMSLKALGLADDSGYSKHQIGSED